MSTYYRLAFAAKASIEKWTEYRWDGLPKPSAFDESLRSGSPQPRVSFFHQAEWYLYFIFLRHYGFPSPLLDWTVSSDAAAFFAFDSMPEGAEQVSVYTMLRGYLPPISENPPTEIPEKYTRALRRHMVQQGKYSLCFKWTFPCEFFNHAEYIDKPEPGQINELIKWTIPARERSVALRALEQRDINAYSLLCTDDALIKTIARQLLLLGNAARPLDPRGAMPQLAPRPA